MHAHQADLRSELSKSPPEPYRDPAVQAALVPALAHDWRTAGLTPLDAALCAYAEKLTRTPATMSEADLTPLRTLGLDDLSLHDLIQVTSFFNYINRIADAVHVELEPEMPPYPD